MRIKDWSWTLRSFGLLLFCAVGIGLLRASDAADSDIDSSAPASITAKAEIERTYLYYFESGESQIDDATPEAYYAFGTLPKEKVTLVAYGLDDIVLPRLVFTDPEGNTIAEAAPTSNPHVVLYQFEATEKRLYEFTVSRRNETDSTGLVRVMLFQGDPLTKDTTLLDNVNPLLPGRSFMVGSKKEDEGGLRMEVEALPISRFNNERPEIFASRGTNAVMPTLKERIEADSIFTWVNVETEDTQFYTVTVRATPETMDGMANLKFRQLNSNTFFYYDYYLIIGAGGEIVTVTRGNDCEAQPNRVECIRNSGNETGRTERAPVLEPTVPTDETKFEEATPVDVIDFLPPPPPITTVTCDINGENPLNPRGGTNGDDQIGGTNCNDEIYGYDGKDNIAGGPGNDRLYGGSGNDVIRGDDGDDLIYGGTGDDKIDGGTGYDVIHPGTGSDNVGYLKVDYDRLSYDDLTAGVTINLGSANSTVIAGAVRDCRDENTPPAPEYTGYVWKGGVAVDCIRGQFDVVATNFNDTVTNNSLETNYIDTLAGDDKVNILGSNFQVFTGDGNDTVNFSGILNGLVSDSDSSQTSAPTATNFDPDGTEIYNFANNTTGTVTIDDHGGADLIDFTAITTTGITAYLQGGTITAGGLTVTLSSATEIENLNGTNQADFIHTSNGNNTINSNNGDDTIYGSCGTDTLNAGTGTDTLDYSEYGLPTITTADTGVNANLATNATTKLFAACGGADTLSGFENIIGSNGIDTLTGDNLVNIISGGTGNDAISGGGGNDTLNGDAGADTINGDAGNDTINGGIGDDTIDGGDDTDTINGDAGNDTVHGGNGNDTLNGGFGFDQIYGDAGNDTVTIINGGDLIDAIDGGAGTDVIDASGYTASGISIDLTNGTYGTIFGTITGVENIIGTNNNDTLRGDAGVNNIQGGAGNDTIRASAGNDVIDGGTNLAGTALNPGDTVDYTNTGANNIDVSVDGTNISVTLNGLANTQTLTNVENVIGGPASGTVRSTVIGPNTITYYDDVRIQNGAAVTGPLTSTSPSVLIDSNNNATATWFHFDAAATGAVVFDNNQFDSVTFAAAATFDPYTINTYQNVSAGLYVMITTPLTTFCPAGGLNITIAANGSTSHTQCVTDDTFTAATGASAESIHYETTTDGMNLVVTIAGDTWTVDSTSAATNIGTDTVKNFENMYLGDGNHTIIITGVPTNNATIDLGSLAGATHILDLTGYGQNATVNLNAGVASFTGGGTSTITFTDDITTFLGSAFNDTVTGNALNNIITTNNGDDTIYAGAGDDTITPGAGNDTAYGQGGNDAFFVTLDGGNDVYDGGANTDTLTYDLASGVIDATIDGTDTAVDGATTDSWANFEVVNTGNANDIFTITNPVGYTTINTYGGADTFTINLTAGALPTINAGTGNDIFNVQETLAGSATPLLMGEAGDDTYNITFDGQNNVFDGGADNDTVNYVGATPITLVLQAGDDTASNGGVTDTLRNMESITLGTSGDTVTVNDATGYTNVSGGAGNDIFNINAVNTTTLLDGGAGTGDIANFTSAGPTVVTLNGGTQTAVVGGITQQIQNFEGFYTGNGNDTFNVTSDLVTNLFDGNGGTDTAVLASGTGVTINTYGFSGFTTVNDTTGPNAGVFDYYYDIENFTGTGFTDTLFVRDQGIAFDAVNNIYDGAGGADDATYITNQNLNVTVPAVGTDITVNDGGAWTDTLRSFETVASGSGDDTWTMAGVTASYNFNGGAGTDTANYSTVGTALNVTVNATDTTVAQGGFTHTLTNFESILSGSGNDTWTINSGLGTTGKTYNGAGGTDTISYQDTTTDFSYTANLTAGGNTIVDSDPTTPDTDTLVNFETLTTDDAADTINIHNSNIVTVNTLDGNDIIYVGDTGTPGSTDNIVNTFNMGNGTDLLYYAYVTDALTITYTGAGAGTVKDGALATDSFTGVERIAGGTGNDIFNVTADGQANDFYGVGGTDTIDYTGATPIVANLGAGADTVVSGGGTDNLYSFETIIGSSGNDTFNITNGSGYTSIQGDLGDDTFNITNTGGANNIAGGAGNDNYNFTNFDAFNNTITDAAGNNTISYATVATNLNLNLNAASTTVDNTVNTDTFTGTYTNIQTGTGNDDVYVTRALTGATVSTNAGNDTFHFQNAGGIDYIGNGATLLDAGTQLAGGQDTADFSAINGALTVGYTGCGVNTTVTTGAQTTTLTNFESYIGGVASDTFNVTWGPCDVTFNGGGGAANEINYATSGTGLTFTLNGTDTVTDGTNTHSIVSFAILRGTNQADVFDLTNDSAYTDIYGNDGDDVFQIYPTSTATLHAGNGNDEFRIQAADTANSTFDGEAGAQDLYIVDFATNTAYTVTNTSVTAGGFTDTLNNIERITTSNGNDTFNITWDGIANTFDAGGNNGGGVDLLSYAASGTALTFNYTGAGAGTVVNGTTDTFANFESLTGGTANDTFNVTFDAVENTFNGSTGTDTAVMTTAMDYGIVYGLTANSALCDITFTMCDTGTAIENITTSSGDDFFYIKSDGINNTFNASTGTDTVDYSFNAAGITVNYAATVTVVDGAANDTLVGFENITGSTLNDIFNITGDAVTNIFNGGIGTDTADYTSSTVGLTFNLDGGSELVTAGANTDTLVNFESIIASNQNDIFNVTGAGEVQYTALSGLGGNDTFNMEWGATNNTLNGGTGTNSYAINPTTPTTVNLTVTLNNSNGTVTDGTATDTLTNIQNVTTSNGNDTFNITWDGIANTFDASGNNGGGSDLLSYSTSGTALTFNYTGAGAGTVVNGTTDTFANFESFTGGTANDIFNISGWDLIANTFNGGTGTNTLNVTAANNYAVVYSGSGAGTVTSAAITDTFTGMTTVTTGTGTDTFTIRLDGTNNTFNAGTGAAIDTADYSASATGITLTYGTVAGQGTVTDGAATDTLTNFENFTGSNLDDTFIIRPDAVNNTFDGGGDSTATGDLADYSGSTVGLTFNLSSATVTVVAGGGTDSLINFEGFTASNQDDIFNVTGTGETLYTNLNGLGGNDTFNMEWGVTNNAVNGGTGTNTYAVNGTTTTNLTVTLNAGAGSVVAGGVTDTLTNIQNVTSNNGDDTFNITNDNAANTFNGSGGTDTLAYTSATAITVNYTGTGAGTVVGLATDTFTNFENITGSAQNDTFNIAGDAADNTFDGGVGTDTANYSTSTIGLTFNLDGGSELVTAGANTDTLVNFETIVASNQDDIFNVSGAGETQYTTLSGSGGNDTFNIAWGTTNNTFNGGTGTNVYVVSGVSTTNLTVTNPSLTSYTVTDGTTTDTLNNITSVTTNGGNDNFNITWDTANSTFDAAGQTTADTLTYTSTVALTVTYTGAGAGTVVNGANTDTFANFEAVTSGGQADTFNITWDTIDNTFNGGTGNDTADYTPSTTDLTFALDGGSETVTAGTNTDTLTNFEVITGGAGNDTFNVQTTAYDTISTGAGNDTINVTNAAFGAAPADNITFNGGAGTTDTYVYTGTNPLTVSLTAATNTVTSGSVHTLNNVEVVTLNTEAGDNSGVTINNTSQVTEVNTGNGNETVTVTNGGTVTNLTTGAGTDTVNVTTANQMTNIDTGADNDTVSLTQDATSTTVNGNTGTDTFTSTTTAATTVTQTGTSFAVAANSQTDTFQNFENGTFTTGTNNDIFTIDTDTDGTWVINSGTGTNQYNFKGSGLGNVTVTVNTANTTASALDTLDFTQMNVGITVNAGLVNTTQTVAGTFKLILQDAIAKVNGSNYADTITGTTSADTINGNAGADTVYGIAGNDTINGDDGNDTIYGGTGSDTIYGGNDNDLIFGGSLADATCTMGDDIGDVIQGNNGDDTIYGGNNNTAANTGGDNACDDGADDITGGDGTAVSADGNDTLYGGNLNANGTNGDDVGDVSVDGDNGDDVIYGGNNNTGGGSGADGAETSTGGNSGIDGDAGNDEIYGGNNNQGGGSGTDSNSDDIDGGTGTDTAYGGNDNRSGGTGTEAGAGNDTITNSEPNTNTGNR